MASGNPVGQIHDGGRECDGYGTLQFRLERVSPHTAVGKILEPFHALRRHLSGQLHYIRREVSKTTGLNHSRSVNNRMNGCAVLLI